MVPAEEEPRYNIPNMNNFTPNGYCGKDRRDRSIWSRKCLT